MKAPASNRHSGIALIVVMIAITVLSILTVAFAFTMKVETKLAQNSNSFEHLRAGGWSGGQYAAWILSAQLQESSETYDGPPQKWTGGAGDDGDSNSILSTVSSLDYTMRDGCKIHDDIVDLESYININTATEAELRQALGAMNMDPGDIDTVVSSILDWVQPGENPRPSGAKSDYYQGLPTPYFCKDGPMDDISELLLVKGVTYEMFYGPDAGNGSRAVFQGAPDASAQREVQYNCGLKDLFTAMSTGKVNVETASTNVLAGIPGFNPDLAQTIVDLRNQDPIKNIGELINARGMTSADLAIAAPYIDNRSHTFEVTTTATWGGYSQQFVTVLGRVDPKHIKVLSFRWKDRTAVASNSSATAPQ